MADLRPSVDGFSLHISGGRQRLSCRQPACLQPRQLSHGTDKWTGRHKDRSRYSKMPPERGGIIINIRHVRDLFVGRDDPASLLQSLHNVRRTILLSELHTVIVQHCNAKDMKEFLHSRETDSNDTITSTHATVKLHHPPVKLHNTQLKTFVKLGKLCNGRAASTSTVG